MKSNIAILTLAIAALVVIDQASAQQRPTSPGIAPVLEQQPLDGHQAAPVFHHAGPNRLPQPDGLPPVVAVPGAPMPPPHNIHPGFHQAPLPPIAPGPRYFQPGFQAHPVAPIVGGSMPARGPVGQASFDYSQPVDEVYPEPVVLDGRADGECCDDGGFVSGNGTGLCDTCHPWKYWGRTDLLIWVRRGRATPALITTGDPADAIPGALGQPGTQVLFGDEAVSGDAQAGFRLDLGLWLDDCKEIGIGSRSFFTGEESVGFSAASDELGNPPLFRSFIGRNGVTAEDAFAVAIRRNTNDGGFAGNVEAENTNEILGTEVYIKVNWDRTLDYSLDLLGGYLYTRIDDSLVINSSSVVFADPNTLQAPPGFQAGDQLLRTDQFFTRNEFHGGEIGLTGKYQKGPWTFQFLGKVGFGNMRQRVRIDGRKVNITANPNASFDAPGGILTQPTNIGAAKQDVFAFVPEAGLEVGCQLTDRIRLAFGYDFIYWTSVLLSGDQIDRTVDRNHLNGNPAMLPVERPVFSFRDTDFWAQGANISVHGRF